MTCSKKCLDPNRPRYTHALGGFRAGPKVGGSARSPDRQRVEAWLFLSRSTHPANQSAARDFQAVANAVPAIDQDGIPETGCQGLV